MVLAVDFMLTDRKSYGTEESREAAIAAFKLEYETWLVVVDRQHAAQPCARGSVAFAALALRKKRLPEYVRGSQPDGRDLIMMKIPEGALRDQR